MEKIKQTKSIEMLGDETGVSLYVYGQNGNREMFIPMKSVFQVKRGLVSYIQKFYRKQTK
jgi:hypothetical protein